MTQLLATMEECFMTACTDAHKLDAAVARHFTRLGANADILPILVSNFSICGACNRSMALRHAQRNQDRRGDHQQQNHYIKILACSTCSFACRFPRGVPSALTERNTEPQLCPICKFQVVRITEGDGYTGSGYSVCPKCYTDPPAEYGGATSNDFKCSKCTHPSCSLAGSIRDGDIEIYPCPFCPTFGATGRIFMKKNTKGGFLLSCSNNSTVAQRSCEYCVWLPKAASTIIIPEGGGDTLDPNFICSHCSKPNHVVRKLKFTWKSGSVPPFWEREIIACILCDDLFKDEPCNITFPKIDRVTIRPATNQHISGRGRGRGRSSDNTTGGRGRGRGNQTNHGGRSNVHGRNSQIVCFKCNRPGHFASTCTG